MVQNVPGFKQRILVTKLEANLTVKRSTSAVDGGNVVQIIRNCEFVSGSFCLLTCEILDALLSIYTHILVCCHTGRLLYDW